MQDILRCDGFAADAAFGEGHVLGQTGVQMMANHQHVEMLVNRIDSIRPRRIGELGRTLGSPQTANNIRGVSAARALRMIGVDGAALDAARVASTKPDSFKVSV